MISKLTTRIYRNFSTLQNVTNQGGSVVKREYLQFSKAKLTDFGDLPQGQIPEELQYDLPSELTTLKNGVKVATERCLSPLASLDFLVKAGTRYETLETSGTAQFLEKLNFRGTSSRSREQVENELNYFGNSVTVNTSRETTKYTISFLPSDLDRAVSFISDILLNSSYNSSQIEAERDEIYRNCVENVKDQKQATIEAVHYTSFRDHFISQPVHGVRENIANITEADVKNFHTGNYLAQNFVVAASGNLAHNDVVSSVQKHFENAPTQAPSRYLRPNTEQPFFTGSTMFMRDDEMANLNIGVFFEAPKYADPDFFSMQLLKQIMGEYRADRFTGSHLNNSDRQYSKMHSELGQHPDITLHKCDYFPYSDTGLMGNYLYGNEVFSNQMLYMSQFIMTEYAAYINVVEVIRAKNAIFNQLAGEGNTADRAKQMTEQLAYLGRTIPRSEYAKRISHFDVGLVQKAVSRWFWDKELSVVAWGPTHSIMNFSHYNRPIRRSSMGWYGNTQYKII